MGKLLKSGKVATPITIKTYLPDIDLGGITVSQYLGRLAAAATTISNAGEYGRTVHDLALRRTLITIGEDMAGRAYDAPVEDMPRQQIEEAERKLYALAESGRFEGGFQSFSSALTLAIQMASEAYKRDGGLSGTSTGLTDLDQRMGGLQKSDLIVLADAPAWARPRLRPTSPTTSPRLARRAPAGWHVENHFRRYCRLLQPRNERRAARHTYHRRAIRRALVQDPPW